MARTNWHATSLRIVLFTQQAFPTTSDLFTAFVGEAPDSQEDRPKEGVRRQIGNVDNARLQVTINPVMVDFILTPLPLTAENIMGDLSSMSLGEFDAELAKLERRVLTWLPKWETATTRVSLVVQARAPANSNEEAYVILRDNLTSVRVRPGEMTDLFFRVNWKAKTKTVSEGYFNRLSTWCAINLKAMASTQPSNAGVIIQDRYFAQMEVDLNTPAERAEPLPREQIPIIYSELFRLAEKIGEGGEGP